MHSISIFGYGAVGRETAKSFARRGDAVRVVQRSHPPALESGCSFLAADSTDRDATLRACANVDAVVCALGFPYDSELWRAFGRKRWQISSTDAPLQAPAWSLR